MWSFDAAVHKGENISNFLIWCTHKPERERTQRIYGATTTSIKTRAERKPKKTRINTEAHNGAKIASPFFALAGSELFFPAQTSSRASSLSQQHVDDTNVNCVYIFTRNFFEREIAESKVSCVSSPRFFWIFLQKSYLESLEIIKHMLQCVLRVCTEVECEEEEVLFFASASNDDESEAINFQFCADSEIRRGTLIPSHTHSLVRRWTLRSHATWICNYLHIIWSMKCANNDVHDERREWNL